MSSDEEEAPRRHSIGAKRNPDTAEAIRAAALDILIEEGHAGFSIEKVARRARAGKPTIYRWWPSKAALLLDVYHRQKRDVEYPVTDDLESDLALFLTSLLRYWRDGPAGDIFRSIVAEAQSDPAAREALQDYIAERGKQVAGIISAPRNGPGLAPDFPPRIIAELVQSYAWMKLLIHSLDEPQENARLAVRAILRGAMTVK
ncbi:TetR/AcrR family transcriptional regulator [Nitratireductor indicus]|uniref:TetR/AcrR family transcriptional regulator n=1 Tax=Nitratireductor indicus TaxID=721133 RepID=UPI002876D95F|nr:TetR/AcrR family transcriptional regulator [Nitratireductor indicus]MDS1136311.1 TetR/AcrR family transcriptional regulator [Nitratireductor indicus]